MSITNSLNLSLSSSLLCSASHQALLIVPDRTIPAECGRAGKIVLADSIANESSNVEIPHLPRYPEGVMPRFPLFTEYEENDIIVIGRNMTVVQFYEQSGEWARVVLIRDPRVSRVQAVARRYRGQCYLMAMQQPSMSFGEDHGTWIDRGYGWERMVPAKAVKLKGMKRLAFGRIHFFPPDYTRFDDSEALIFRMERDARAMRLEPATDYVDPYAMPEKNTDSFAVVHPKLPWWKRWLGWRKP